MRNIGVGDWDTRVYAAFFGAWFLLFSSGCAMFGEQNLEQRLYGADSAVTLMMHDAVSLRNEGRIPDDVWPGVKASLKDASKAVDEAWAIYESDPGKASSAMDRVEHSLRAARKRFAAYKGELQ